MALTGPAVSSSSFSCPCDSVYHLFEIIITVFYFNFLIPLCAADCVCVSVCVCVCNSMLQTVCALSRFKYECRRASAIFDRIGSVVVVVAVVVAVVMVAIVCRHCCVMCVCVCCLLACFCCCCPSFSADKFFKALIIFNLDSL